jgi:hypothetical protein
MRYNRRMDINEVLAALEKRGHRVGSAGVSPEGQVIVSIDGTMMTYVEIRELLLTEVEARYRSSTV